MRKALIGLLMAATVTTPLLAQNDERGRDRGGQQRSQQQRPQGQRQGAPNRGAVQPQQVQPQRFQGRQFQGQSQPQQFQQQRFQGRQFQGQPQQYQQQRFQGRQFQAQPQQDRSFQGGRRGPVQGGFAPQGGRDWRGSNRGGVGWDRGWRNNGRYDWQRYRYENRGVFHLGPYYAPYRGYYYNPLEIGIVLDSLFYNRNYWIDPGYYNLPPAPPGAEWIRYYNDVVLVDVYSGQVIDVIHDFFW